MNNTGIVVQARMGSTRLPQKVLLPFYEKETILSIIFKRLKKIGLPIILATSINSEDDVIEDFGAKNDLLVFRGDEQNVLQRMAQAADRLGVQIVIRVCADNPFLDGNLLNKMIQIAKRIDFDYLSYSYKSTPGILTHFGVFCEMVSINALKNALALTQEKIYLEHVTNYIYKNPGRFDVKFIPLSWNYFIDEDIRFTVDTKEDFEVASKIYNLSMKQFNNVKVSSLNKVLKSNPAFLKSMKKQKVKNSK